MKHGFRRLAALVLAAALLLPTVFASGASPDTVRRADQLASLGLFRGTDQGYALDAAPDRMQGLVMLIRLLGQDSQALACTQATPFTDLPAWGAPYAAHAYAAGLTQGSSATTFSPGVPLKARDYVTFLLRALGYSDTAGDFTWNGCLSFAAQLGMIDAASADALDRAGLNRGDMVDLSYAALTTPKKGGAQTLAESLRDAGIFTQAQGQAAGVLGGSRYVCSYVPYEEPIVHTRPTLSTSQGEVTVNVLTVNTKDPRVSVRTVLVGRALGATASFQNIVAVSGAKAVVNGNFFTAYDDYKQPIGHVMSDGEFLLGISGLSSLGVSDDGTLQMGRPALFTRIKAGDGRTQWSAYEINSLQQGADLSVMYTPAFGKSVEITEAGSVMEVSGGVITGYRAVSPGQTETIPANGFLVHMGTGFTSTSWFSVPVPGTAVSTEYYLQTADAEGFTLDGVENIVSGGPRLVQDGAIVTTLEPQFGDARFTTLSSTRTAAGIHRSGKLVLVQAPSATIQQMREIMLALGCVDAVNLDGGASCAMYYDGAYLATPGRELTTTLQIFVSP